MMTFEEAVAYLTRDGDTLLEALELIQDELYEAESLGEEPMFLSPKEIMAYRLVVAKMRPLFA